MYTSLSGPTPRFAAGAAALLLALTAGCGGKEAPSPTAANPAATAPAAPAATAGSAATPPAPLQTSTATWTPEALEQLLAPVALYPDVVLVQVLTAATNPQEVLDAGNWLIANASLTGKSREESAQQAGFTPPIRGLMQSPEVIDKMCLNMGWTEEVGQAYVNDQAGVTSAVQRLRAQAKDVGTLASSDKLKVETVAAASPSEPPVIRIEPPSPQVVYVPQYDPVAAFAPTPASTAVPVAGTTTTTTTQSGHSTGTLVTTGLLSFGAGILVANIFDDDDDYWNSGYYGNMWSRPMPYYPPYPYRPVYGNGFYPGYGYNRPPSWGNNGWGNNTNIIINQDNDYWNSWGDDDSILANRREPRSPITAAKPTRPELARLNAEAAKGPKRPAPSAAQTAEWKGQKGYAGADPTKRAAAASAAATARDRGPATPGAAAGARDRVATAPKVQGTYAGARPGNAAGAARPGAAKLPTGPASAAKMAPNARPAGYDRGRVADAAAARPTAVSRPSRPTPELARPASRPAYAPESRPARPAYSPESRPARPAYAQESRPSRPAYSQQSRPTPRPGMSPNRSASKMARPAPSRTAMSGANRGGADRAASARGRASTGGKVPVQSRQAAAARQPRGR
jgi:hypothetical protein